jgi:signal transduction histidine kinase
VSAVPVRPAQTRLEDLDRDALLTTARQLLVEADALSSRIAAVNEISVAINRTLNLEEILRVVGRQAKWLLDFDHLSVCLPVEDGGAGWTVKVLFGEGLPGAPDPLSNPAVGRALTLRHPQIVRAAGDTRNGEAHFLADYPAQIIYPLVAEEMVLGTINFASSHRETYSTEDMRIVYLLVLQLASALRNARNFRELQATRDVLRERNTELEERNAELDAYNHTIAHDLKSPLTAISMRSEMLAMLLRDKADEKILSINEGILDGARRMAGMIDQLLMLAKARRLTETALPINARDAINGAILRFPHLIEKSGVTIAIEDPIPLAMGHTQLVEEVFANLIGNAIKYMGEDRPERRITVRGMAQGAFVRYEVQDTGVGITPEDRARLFQMFTRLHTVKADGLGLGLSIVSRIVTRLGGQVGVDSTFGVGSTFWFTLPALPVPGTAPVLLIQETP